MNLQTIREDASWMEMLVEYLTADKLQADTRSGNLLEENSDLKQARPRPAAKYSHVSACQQHLQQVLHWAISPSHQAAGLPSCDTFCNKTAC